MDKPDAIEELRRRHRKAADYFAENDRPGEWLDSDGSWKDWESEAEGSAAEARRDALAEALDLLGAKPIPADPPSIDQLASLARTALDDPAGLPPGELDEFVEAAESYDRIYGDAAPAPAGQYAIAQLDAIINTLNPATEDRHSFAYTLTVLGRHLEDRRATIDALTPDTEEPDTAAYKAAAAAIAAGLDYIDTAISAMKGETP